MCDVMCDDGVDGCECCVFGCGDLCVGVVVDYVCDVFCWCVVILCDVIDV